MSDIPHGKPIVPPNAEWEVGDGWALPASTARIRLALRVLEAIEIDAAAETEIVARDIYAVEILRLAAIREGR